MSESVDTAAILERPQSVLKSSVLTIDVNRFGEPGQKMLRFTIQDFDISSSQYVYNIRHVIGLESMVDSVAIFNGSGDVFVTLQHWQLIDEDLVVKLAKSIGNALGFVYGHTVIIIGRLC